MSSFVQLEFETLFVSSKRHPDIVFPLTESKSDIKIVSVWILPELTSKSLIPLIIWQQVLNKELLIYFLDKTLIHIVLPYSQDSVFCLALGLLMNFLQLVNKSFEFFLRQLFLLDDLTSDVGANCPITLSNLCVQIS